jgi:hypothetical protein
MYKDGHVKVIQKLSFSIYGFSIFNISFEPDNVFNFQLVSQQLLILFFGFVKASAVKHGVLNLFVSDCFLMLSIKRRFSNPALQKSGSNPS